MTYFPIFRLSIQGMKRRNLEEGHCKNLWKSVSIPLSKVPAYIYQGTAAAAAAAAAKSLQSCPALCDPIGASPLGSPIPGILQARTLEKVAQSCPTLCDSKDYAVHGILQARILEWVVFPFSKRSSQPRDQTQVSHIAGGFFTSWATREAPD